MKRYRFNVSIKVSDAKVANVAGWHSRRFSAGEVIAEGDVHPDAIGSMARLGQVSEMTAAEVADYEADVKASVEAGNAKKESGDEQSKKNPKK